MTFEETKTILIMIAAAYPNAKQSNEAVKIWHEMLKNCPRDLVIDAVKQHIATNAWEPKISELLKEVEKKTLPPTLTMSASEAYAQPPGSKLMLVVEARRFAAMSVPFHGGQFENPAALATASRIHDVRYEKEFKQRFETLQNQAKARVHLGATPKEAIVGLLSEMGVPLALRIKGTMSPKVTKLVGDVSGSMGQMDNF